MRHAIKIHAADDVAVATRLIEPGERVFEVCARETVPPGHKVALRDIACGENIVKYGHPIGHATQNIRAGEWVHAHNAATNLQGLLEYRYEPVQMPECEPFTGSFMGYERSNGAIGVRNEVWILPLVGCVNKLAERLAERALCEYAGKTDGVFAFTHPYGCSQIGEDLAQTKALLVAMARHPNAGGVLVLGLGCENNTLDSFREALGTFDANRVRFLVAQDVADEQLEGMRILAELVETMRGDVRTEQPISRLIIGLKCGGSDGYSGLTANPLLGALSDGLCAAGGTTLLTEVPEMFGAETILMNRAANEALFHRTVEMINRYKRYFLRYGEGISDNPSPGNKDGGLTTLEDKSLGCTQKGGTGAVCGVLDYAQGVQAKGLNLVYAPGNDGCAMTALMAAGAQIILFTTGRGTPMGSSVPTIKISTNTSLAEKKPNWIDYDAGVLLDGLSMEQATGELMQLVLRVANGARANNEKHGYREIVIFKDGVTE